MRNSFTQRQIATLTHSPAPSRRGSGRRGGFTLAELLVVIGIIAVVTGITAISFRLVARDARMASAMNTVKASLDNARALAMKNNEIVLVVFRPRLEGSEQFVEAVVAKWSGESYVTNGGWLVDRFVQLDDVPVRRIAKGVKIACPRYGETGATNVDEMWDVCAHLPAIDQSNPTSATSEVGGALIGVMFAPDGTSITRNSQSDSNRSWVDFDDDRLVIQGATSIGPGSGSVDDFYFDQRLEIDEPFVTIAPFIAVFDDEEARENFDATNWQLSGGYDAARLTRLTDLTGYINNNADRLHFNRYTGVIME